MSYTSIAPAHEWYCVVLPSKFNPKPIVWPVAVWALTEKGDVVGLISVASGGPDDISKNPIGRLITPPPLAVIYKHKDELAEAELESLNSEAKSLPQV